MFDKAIFDLVIQGGSFALVVVIVGWVLYWTPKWVAGYWTSRESDEKSRLVLADQQAAAMKEVAAITAAAVKEVQKEQKEALTALQKEQKETLARLEADHKDSLLAQQGQYVELAERQEVRSREVMLLQQQRFDERAGNLQTVFTQAVSTIVEKLETLTGHLKSNDERVEAHLKANAEQQTLFNQFLKDRESDHAHPSGRGRSGRQPVA